MVNLRKVKRTSIAVVVALIMLFCVRRNLQARIVEYVEHILQGSTKTVIHAMMRYIPPATKARGYNFGN